MTREDIIRMAREAGKVRPGVEYMPLEVFERFAHLVAAAEREACAKVLDEMAAKDTLSNYYKVAALAIRERGAP
jgi:hypothetical protein